MKLISFNEILNKFKERFYSNKKIISILDLIELLLTIFLFSHIFACIWILLA